MNETPHSSDAPRSAQGAGGATCHISRWHRSRRVLGWALTLFSVALFAVSASLWVRSSKGGDVFWYRTYSVDEGLFDIVTWDISTKQGRIFFKRDRYVMFAPAGQPDFPQSVGFTWTFYDTPGNLTLRWGQPETRLSRVGFDAADRSLGKHPRRPAEPGRRIVGVSAPFWSLGILFMALPAVATVRLTRRLIRKSRGLCIECGYDLRASAEQCPECGARTAPARSAATGVGSRRKFRGRSCSEARNERAV